MALRPTDHDVRQIVETTARRVVCLLKRRGLQTGGAGAAVAMPARPGAGRVRNRTWPTLRGLCSLFRRAVTARQSMSRKGGTIGRIL